MADEAVFSDCLPLVRVFFSFRLIPLSSAGRMLSACPISEVASPSAYLRLGIHQHDAKPKVFRAAVALRFVKPFDQNASIRLDDAARCDVVRIRCQLDIGEPFGSRVRQKKPKRPRGVPSATFPRHDRIPDM